MESADHARMLFDQHKEKSVFSAHYGTAWSYNDGDVTVHVYPKGKDFLYVLWNASQGSTTLERIAGGGVVNGGLEQAIFLAVDELVKYVTERNDAR